MKKEHIAIIKEIVKKLKGMNEPKLRIAYTFISRL